MTPRTSEKERLRRRHRNLRRATVSIAGRSILFGGVVLGAILAVAVFGPALDRRGLPGVVFALVILGLLVILSLWVVVGEFPPRGRRRMLARLAKADGRSFRIRPRVPRSMTALPTFADDRTAGRDVWHLSVFPGRPVILTFDRRIVWADAYEAPTWFACAAAPIRFGSPLVVVEPRPWVTADPLGPLTVWKSESGAFERRFRIRTSDRLFATALLDQRMLEWILGLEDDWRLEIGGGWAMVAHGDLSDPTMLERSVQTLRSFLARIPGAATSMRSSLDR